MRWRQSPATAKHTRHHGWFGLTEFAMFTLLVGVRAVKVLTLFRVSLSILAGGAARPGALAPGVRGAGAADPGAPYPGG